MKCPFQSEQHGLVHCELISMAFRESPCDRCQSHWVDGEPPTCANDNPILIEITAKTPDPKPVAPTPLPSLSSMLANFAGSMLQWAASGFRVVDETTFQSRLAECSRCEHWKDNRCRKCGCWSVKHHLATASCPLDPPKWGPVEVNVDGSRKATH